MTHPRTISPVYIPPPEYPRRKTVVELLFWFAWAMVMVWALIEGFTWGPYLVGRWMIGA